MLVAILQVLFKFVLKLGVTLGFIFMVACTVFVVVSSTLDTFLLLKYPIIMMYSLFVITLVLHFSFYFEYFHISGRQNTSPSTVYFYFSIITFPLFHFRFWLY